VFCGSGIASEIGSGSGFWVGMDGDVVELDDELVGELVELDGDVEFAACSDSICCWLLYIGLLPEGLLR
jgi:hypothetical protein